MKITGLTSHTSPISTDVLPVVDITNISTKKIALSTLSTYILSMLSSGQQDGVNNLKLVVNAAVNKLDIFSVTGGAVPDANNLVYVKIPDANGLVYRSRGASYLSGTSQIVMNDAANYWSKGSLDGEIKTAYLYAIWDGTGIVWALGGYSGFRVVSTTTTATDDDFLLLEYGSTYTRSASHYCVAFAKIRYQYDTADSPDHTIQASGENAPEVVWNPKSDYWKSVMLASSVVQGSNIADASYVSAVVKQSGAYLIVGDVGGNISFNNSGFTVALKIKVGSATYGSATQIMSKYTSIGQNDYDLFGSWSLTGSRIYYLNTGDSIHLGSYVSGDASNRTLQADATGLTFKRID